MESKRELTSIDIAAIVAELDAYRGAVVDKAYLYNDGMIRLKLRDFDRGRVELLIEVGDKKRIHVAEPTHVPDAPERPPNFARMLRNRLAGASLTSISQYEFDRIVTLGFDRGGDRTDVVAELFGQGNVAVVDGLGDVIDSMSTVRLRSRTVAPGARYGYPDTRVNPMTISRDGFHAVVRDSEADLVRTLATQVNLGGLYAEELCHRADVDKEQAAKSANDSVLNAVYGELERLVGAISDRQFEPQLYENDETVIDVTPIPIERYASLEATSFSSFNEAVDTYYYRLGRSSPSTDTRRPDFEAAIERKQRIIQQQEEAINRFDEQADAERQKAELLYTHYGLVDDIISTIKDARNQGLGWDEIEATVAAGAEQDIEAATAVQSVDGSTGHVTIDLDGTSVEVAVDSGVERNADRLYTEAKDIAGKKAGAIEAIERTREELADLKRERDSWTEDDEPAVDPDPAKPVDWLNRSSIPVKRSEPWYDRFRWFHTSDGFLVIGGRNANQNEQLVKKYLDPHDRFFHTTAHGGPVTILKATGPSEPSKAVEFPEGSLNEAAQFAVSYSSVWKDGRFTGDAYVVSPEQVSKTPESGEYLEKGGFVIRGERTYFRDVSVAVSVGITCEPTTGVIGGPPTAIVPQSVTSIRIEPGRYAQEDIAKRIYREFRERFADTTFIRKIASPDLIQEFLPPGGSHIIDDE